MKKIGIITYHFAINYGAVLQCFALQEYLKKQNYDVKVINYVNNIQKMNNDLFKKNNGLKSVIENLLMLPFITFRKNKIKKFKKFRNDNLNETKLVQSIEELKELIKLEQFDYIISGSDQVFNPKIEDFDLAFVFPFESKALKISYAASLGSVKEEIGVLKNYLQDFYKISLREINDKYVVDKYINHNIEIVCDPVFLLSKSEWENILKKVKVNYNNENYMLCYFLHKEYMKQEINLAKKIAKEKKIKLIFINARFSKYSFNFNTLLDCGPSDFIKLIEKAQYICTDSFHGLAFSILFNKDFTCFDSINNIKDSRKINLLESVGLENKYCNVESKKINYDPIDYEKVNKKLIKFSNNSKRFLNLK